MPDVGQDGWVGQKAVSQGASTNGANLRDAEWPAKPGDDPEGISWLCAESNPGRWPGAYGGGRKGETFGRPRKIKAGNSIG